ncbi:hypothetical protein Tco_0809555, partial [Tanacetum coccineum]
TDIAKITRKRSKPDKHGHETERVNKRRKGFNNAQSKVASDDLRDALSVIYLTYAHSRFIHVRFGNESGVYNTEGSSPFMRVYQLNDPPRAIVTSTLSCLWMPRTIREAALQSSPSSDNSPIPEADQDEEDDDMDIEADDEEEEEEHLAPTDSVVVALPATDQAPSAEEIEPFETDESVATPPPHPAYHTRLEVLGRLCFVATRIREISREIEWRGCDMGAPTPFETRVRQDTNEIYTRLDDEQSQRQLLAGRLNMLFRDRRAHAYTRHQMETEARLSREAWRRSMDASDLARREVMSLRTTVLDHRRSAEMRELRTADHTRQQQLIQTLTVMQSLQGQVTTLQGQVAALQGQVTALQGQQGPVGGPAQPELPEEAGSSS